MVQFWLDNISSLISSQNFNFDGVSQSEKSIQMLNIIALVSLVVGLSLTFKKKKVIYFGAAVVVMSFTILLKSNIVVSAFTNVNNIDNAFDTGAFLVRNIDQNDPSGINNKLYVNEASNINKGDIIALSNNNSILETNIVSDIKSTVDTQEPVIILLNPLNGRYSKLCCLFV
jgi:hypothetical protein